MPARKRHQEDRRASARPSWTMMLRADVRASEERRIRRDYAQVAQALDWMASQYDVFQGKDAYGFTVFSDWVLQFLPRALLRWPANVPRFSDARNLYNPVFPGTL